MRVMISFRGQGGDPTDLTEKVRGNPPWKDGDKLLLDLDAGVSRFIIGTAEQRDGDWFLLDLAVDTSFSRP